LAQTALIEKLSGKLGAVWFPILGNPGTGNMPQCILVAFVAAFAIWKHKSNIQRLAKGCENKIY
jgi:glycerol-3-phosphate acyltransferase PlsY